MMMLSQELLAKLRKATLVVKTRKRGTHKGLRRSPKFGSSLEFSDFRAYQPGDDLRQIDWNIYGRTMKHYIKRYLDEQEIKTAIYLDCTASVNIIESKWERAKQIAAAFTYLALSNEDQVSFIPVETKQPRIIHKKGSFHAKASIFEILNLQVKNEGLSFTESIKSHFLKGKQLTIIITDGLEPIDHYEGVLEKFAFLKGEVWFIQLLSRIEIHPEYHGDIKLIDSETRNEVNVSMKPRIISQYEKKLNEHTENLKLLCKRLGFGYLLVDDTKTIDEIILRDCISHGWIR
ncbi:DUF58 domain-containing protein [Heyndrickxia sp. NPDC080065]|uniref:DUF58 domain-containing protein n=1 Tax=Heyndrickxia sp. NPDC080065 TaxID=3390568 RepID=UPI003CFD9DC6